MTGPSPQERVVMVKASERAPLRGALKKTDGLRVVSADTKRGDREAVLPTGAHDVYSVRTPQGEVRMIPAVREVVLRILPEEGIMEVRPLEGLWD